MKYDGLPIVQRLCLTALNKHKGNAKAASVELGIASCSVIKYANQGRDMLANGKVSARGT